MAGLAAAIGLPSMLKAADMIHFKNPISVPVKALVDVQLTHISAGFNTSAPLWATESSPMTEEIFNNLQNALKDYSKFGFRPQYEILSPQEFDRRIERL